MYLHALLLWTTDFDFFCFIFRVQSQTSQSHPHVQNPASAHHQVSWSIIHRIHCAFMKIVEVHVILWFTILFLYMAAQEKFFFFNCVHLWFSPPDIQKVDSAHHQWMNLYRLDSAVGFLNTYLSDSDVQTEDNAIQRINLCPVDNALISLILSLWIVFYPMDNAIQCLNNQAHCTVYISGPGSGACTSSGSRTTAAVPTIKGRFLEVWTKESTIQKFC